MASNSLLYLANSSSSGSLILLEPQNSLESSVSKRPASTELSTPVEKRKRSIQSNSEVRPTTIAAKIVKIMNPGNYSTNFCIKEDDGSQKWFFGNDIRKEDKITVTCRT